MVTIDRINSDYTVYYDNQAGLYRAMCNRCGGTSYSDSNATTVIQSAIDALTNGGTIFFRAGTYDIDSTLTIPATEGLRLSLIGDEEKRVTIRHTAGNLDSLIDALATGYEQGSNYQLLTIKNIQFEIETKDSNTKCLDLEYITTNLDKVTVYNTNSTRQGYGIYAGPSANPAMGTWINVHAYFFGTGFYIRQDHITGINLVAQDNAECQYRIAYCRNVSLINSHSFFSDDSKGSGSRHYTFEGCFEGVSLFNASAERNTGTHIFTYLAEDEIVNVYGYRSNPSCTDDLVSLSDLVSIKFNGSTEADLDRGSYSYLIFTDGTNYYAENGTTRLIDYCNSDATAVIQDALNALTNGGKIFIRAGTYDVANITLDKDNVFIEGEGTSTILRIAGSPGSTTYIFKVERADDRVENFGIRNMKLTTTGGTTNKRAIHIHGSFKGDFSGLVVESIGNVFTIDASGSSTANRRIWIRRCYFHQIYGWIMYATSAVSNGTGYNGAIHFEDCWHYNSAQHSGSGGYYSQATDGGIGLTSCSTHYTANAGIDWTGNAYYIVNSSIENFGETNVIDGERSRIEGTTFQTGDKHGLEIKGYCNEIIGNFFINNGQAQGDTYSGLVLLDNVQGNIVQGNIARDTQGAGSRTQKYGIDESSGCDYNVITGNYCRYNVQSDACHVTGSNSVDANNIEAGGA